ncbi:hypothetical protein J4228_02995 [Candidatus Woesearchaeota archaeon]|nr:hypothetical protein [Candidatus Woesearchaeota archaeon]
MIEQINVPPLIGLGPIHASTLKEGNLVLLSTEKHQNQTLAHVIGTIPCEEDRAFCDQVRVMVLADYTPNGKTYQAGTIIDVSSNCVYLDPSFRRY